MSDEELVDVYDDSGKKAGVATRYEAHRRGLWHHNFHCWVVTRRGGGSVLFQVRSRSKPSFPGLLDSTVGGHYKSGERTADVSREVEEEIGVKIRFADLVPLGTRVDVSSYRDVSKREIANVYFLRSEIPLTKYHVDADEIEGLVEVELEAGMRLFSGKTKRIVAKGARWHPKARRWQNITTSLDIKRFVPKMDSYYLTLFIMAKRFLSDEEYLSI